MHMVQTFIGYNLIQQYIVIIQQSACLVFYPISVSNYAFFFNYTPVGRSPDSGGLDLKLFPLVGWDRSFLSVVWPSGVQLVFLFCSEFWAILFAGILYLCVLVHDSS